MTSGSKSNSSSSRRSRKMKRTLSNCFGVFKSSPPLLSILVFTQFYFSFVLTLFSIIGFSLGAPTLSLMLMAALQTIIAVPGYVYITKNEPLYLLVFGMMQLAAFSMEALWMFILLGGTGFSVKFLLLFIVTLLQAANVIVAFFYRDLRIDFCCCGKNRSSSESTAEEGAAWAKVEKPSSKQNGDERSKKGKKSKDIGSSLRDVLKKKRSTKSVDFSQEVEGTADSPLEKNLFGHISEEEKRKSMHKSISRLPVETPEEEESAEEVLYSSVSTKQAKKDAKRAKRAALKAMGLPKSGSKSAHELRTVVKKSSGSRSLSAESPAPKLG